MPEGLPTDSPATKGATVLNTDTPKNKIFCAVPLYGPVPPQWVINWSLFFTRQLGKVKARFHLVEMGYVEAAANFNVDTALQCRCGHGYLAHRTLCQKAHAAGKRCTDPKGHCRDFVRVNKAGQSIKPRRCSCRAWNGYENFDYFCSVEADNVIPDGWLERVQDYNPKNQPIVGLIYFGKNSEDQRPIPGYFIKKGPRKGDFERLQNDQLRRMGLGLGADPANRGFHKVDVIGMGATAIHRDVYLNWPHDKLPWYQNLHVPPGGFMGQDVLFCKRAAEQGLPIQVDTYDCAGHIGPWMSTLDSFTRSQQFVADRQRAA